MKTPCCLIWGQLQTHTMQKVELKIPLTWQNTWISGLETLLTGVVTPFVTGRAPPCTHALAVRNTVLAPESWIFAGFTGGISDIHRKTNSSEAVQKHIKLCFYMKNVSPILQFCSNFWLASGMLFLSGFQGMKSSGYDSRICLN